ncbi:RNA-binding RNA processing protein rpp1 [Microbotryomycetes sp. JL221]|nr:RNA-binding RNA processing protein rpp1 [Microbotryomycetes sp. JL221]
MHGYIDSFPVPMHPPASWSSPSSSTTKGKQKQTPSSSTSTTDDTYDVVKHWTRQELTSVRNRIMMASKLGYSTVVLIVTITAYTNPSTIMFPTPLIPELDPRTSTSSGDSLVLQMWRIHVQAYNDEQIKSASVKGVYGFSNSTASLFPTSTSLLSVSPTSTSAFSHVSLSLSPPSTFSPTLISLDPSGSNRLPFQFKRGFVNTCQRNGVMFELTYRGLVKQDDNTTTTMPTSRRNWIAGARELVRATGGKGIVLSSGALDSCEQRGTQDLINLCHLIGLTPLQAKQSITLNPKQAIMRGLAMRQTLKGVISNPSLVVTTTKTTSNSTSDSASMTTQGVNDNKLKRRRLEEAHDTQGEQGSDNQRQHLSSQNTTLLVQDDTHRSTTTKQQTHKRKREHA